MFTELGWYEYIGLGTLLIMHITCIIMFMAVWIDKTNLGHNFCGKRWHEAGPRLRVFGIAVYSLGLPLLLTVILICGVGLGFMYTWYAIAAVATNRNLLERIKFREKKHNDAEALRKKTPYAISGGTVSTNGDTGSEISNTATYT